MASRVRQAVRRALATIKHGATAEERAEAVIATLDTLIAPASPLAEALSDAAIRLVVREAFEACIDPGDKLPRSGQRRAP